MTNDVAEWFERLPSYNFFSKDLTPKDQGIINLREQAGCLGSLLGLKAPTKSMRVGILGKRGDKVYYLEDTAAIANTPQFGTTILEAPIWNVLDYNPY